MEGVSSESDLQEGQPADDLAELFTHEADIPAADARELAAEIVDAGLKFDFVNTRFESPAFFSIERRGGVVLVKLNTTHPAYRHLVEALEGSTAEASEGELRRRLEDARDGLRLLLMAWARFEDEASGIKEERLKDVRVDWGRMARDFLRSGDES